MGLEFIKKNRIGKSSCAIGGLRSLTDASGSLTSKELIVDSEKVSCFVLGISRNNDLKMYVCISANHVTFIFQGDTMKYRSNFMRVVPKKVQEVSDDLYHFKISLPNGHNNSLILRVIGGVFIGLDIDWKTEIPRIKHVRQVLKVTCT
jgi:hypothetical protein